MCKWVVATRLLQNNKSEFLMQGMSGLTNMVYNSGTKSWEMVSVVEKNLTDKTVLGFYNGTKQFPMGVRKWFLKGNCNYKTDEFEMSTLKFTKVSRKQLILIAPDFSRTTIIQTEIKKNSLAQFYTLEQEKQKREYSSI